MATSEKLPTLPDGWQVGEDGRIKRPFLVSTVCWYLTRTDRGAYMTERVQRDQCGSDLALIAASEGTIR